MGVNTHYLESDNYQMTVNFSNVGIIGAGAMGRGIAQIAAQAGSTVLLHDTQPTAPPSAAVTTLYRPMGPAA